MSFNLSFEKYKDLVKKYKNLNKTIVVHLYKDIIVDTETPVSLFLKLADKEKYAYLLESAETSLHWGRYSFISFSPSIMLKFHPNGDTEYITEIGEKTIHTKDPLNTIKRLLTNFYVLPETTKSLPRYVGGFVGYIGYELVHKIEPTVRTPPKNEYKDIPEIFLMFNKILLLFDHYLNRLKVIYLILIDKKSKFTEEYFVACDTIEKILDKIQTAINLTKNFYFSDKINEKNFISEFKENFNQSKFVSMVKRTKKYIYDGDIIQAVISRKVTKSTDAEPFDIYRSLRLINPSPYMFYLKFDNLALIGSSPEVLVRKEGEVIETRPIAGTRPRGKNNEEDHRLEQELINSDKDNAEHIMLVDLARNDLGRVSQVGSVVLPEFKIIEKFSHVMHIVSSVKAIIKKGCESIDVLKSVFPAGTVSGAPKVRAMQIISELEGVTRGPYAGAVGYFSLNGNMDMAITIRTIIYKDKKVYIQTGAGIVANSNPIKEYYETVNKAKALMLAVKIAEDNKKESLQKN